MPWRRQNCCSVSPDWRYSLISSDHCAALRRGLFGMTSSPAGENQYCQKSSPQLQDWVWRRAYGAHVPKGYIYAAMAFSALVEGLNMLSRRARDRRAAAGQVAST